MWDFCCTAGVGRRDRFLSLRSCWTWPRQIVSWQWCSAMKFHMRSSHTVYVHSFLYIYINFWLNSAVKCVTNSVKFIIQNAGNTLVCLYVLLSYPVSSPAVAGHSSYRQLPVLADAHAGDCQFLHPLGRWMSQKLCGFLCKLRFSFSCSFYFWCAYWSD